MKILKLFTLSAVALLLCDCGGDPVPGPGPEQTKPVEEAAYVKLGSGQSSSVSVGYDGAEIPVSFSTNKNWTAEVSFGASSSGWVSLSERNGSSGSRTLIASVSGNNESSQRSSVITIKAGNASATVTISQEAFKSEFSISPKVVETPSEGGTVEVSVTSNIGYHASTSVDWIYEMSTKATETRSLWFIVDANESVEPRSGVIVICNDDEVCIPVTVNQAGIPASISVAPSILNFTSQGGTESIDIFSNTGWVVSQSPEWCTVSLASGSGDTSADVNVKENGNTYPREGKIVFSAGEVTAEVAVNQQAGQPQLDVSNKKLSIPGSGGNASFTVTSNADWAINTGASWLSASVSGGSGNAQVTLTAEPNPDIKARTAELTVSTADGSIQKVVSVTQSEGEVFLELDVYTLQFDHLERCSQVKVTSNDSWSAVSSASWCTVQKIASGGALDVCVKANDTGKSRTAQITVKTKSGGLEKTITVSQSTPEANEGFGDDGQIKWD